MQHDTDHHVRCRRSEHRLQRGEHRLRVGRARERRRAHEPEMPREMRELVASRRADDRARVLGEQRVGRFL